MPLILELQRIKQKLYFGHEGRCVLKAQSVEGAALAVVNAHRVKVDSSLILPQYCVVVIHSLGTAISVLWLTTW